MAKHFIVGAGGTGMRQLESFVHLCSAGVFPNDEFHLLSIDTDVTNGNRSKLIRLTELYEKIKGDDIPSDSGLFSAKIKSYHFAAIYNEESEISIEQIIQQLNIDNEDNIELSKLLLSENTRSFSLEHGYKAQTQLGSLHMFASILNSMHKFFHGTTADRSKNNIIHNYLNEMTEDSQLFVVGSVFGGTGASSVPIIPKAFKAAYKYISLTNSLPIAILTTASTAIAMTTPLWR
ncbi:MAG: hypothetical protein HF967_01650, partial [Methanosarcinales archaeon]|nr:hypothetical protein [Methanosarcinales archaeon]